MIPCARCILLNLYHILVDGLFDTVPFVLSFMALAYGSGETDVGLVVSLDNVRYFSHIEKIEVARQVG